MLSFYYDRLVELKLESLFHLAFSHELYYDFSGHDVGLMIIRTRPFYA